MWADTLDKFALRLIRPISLTFSEQTCLSVIQCVSNVVGSLLASMTSSWLLEVFIISFVEKHNVMVRGFITLTRHPHISIIFSITIFDPWGRMIYRKSQLW